MRIKPLALAVMTLGSVLPLSAIAATAATPSNKSTKTAVHQTVSETAKPELKNMDTNGVPAVQQDQQYLQQQQLDALSQNSGVPKGPWDWYKHIHLSGLINTDASYWSLPYFNQGSHGSNSTSYITLPTANLNIDANLGPWASAHVALVYTAGSSPAVRTFRKVNRINNNFDVQDAYATIANFSKSPFFIRAGQQFLPFGRYHLYPITISLTQVLSQTSAPSAQVGFISKSGFYASGYAASGKNKVTDSNRVKINVFGAELGYQNLNNAVGYDLGLGYLSNMADVNSIRDVINDNGGYVKSVGGVSFYGDLYAGPFGFGLRYVSALSRFDSADYAYTNDGVKRGAKPSAAGLHADYNFMTWGHNSRINVGYQWSSEAHNTATGVSHDNITVLPSHRWLIGYGVNIIRHVALGLQFYQDKDYKVRQGGTGKHDNVVTARISFLF